MSMATDDQPVDRSNPLRWWGLAAATMAVFMSTLDTSIVNVALPTMASGFNVGPDSIKWVVLSYMLPLAGVLAIAGRMCDVFGRRKIFLWGLIIFALGSALCGVSTSLFQLISFRVIQGIGGSLIAAPIAAIATALFPPHERGKAMGLVGTIGPLGAITGPSIGGFLISDWGWSSIFFINIPISIVCFFVTRAILPAEQELKRTKFDWVGTLLLSGATFALLFGLSGQETDQNSLKWILLIVAVLGFLLFPYVESKVKEPVIPTAMLKSVPYSLPLLGMVASSIVGSMLGFLNPFYLQEGLGKTPWETGITVLFIPLAMAIAAPIGGTLSDRYSPKLSASLGAAVVIAGLILLTPLSINWDLQDVMWRLFIIGLGIGLYAAPTQHAIMEATPPAFLGISSAVTNMLRYIGFSLGPAFATLIWIPTQSTVSFSSASMRGALYLGIGIQLIAFLVSFVFKKRDNTKHRSPTKMSENTTKRKEQNLNNNAIDELSAAEESAKNIKNNEEEEKMSINVLVTFYSLTGTIATLAEVIGEGSKEIKGVDVRLRRVADTIPYPMVENNEHLKKNRDQMIEKYPVPTHEDLLWADAIILGSPTRFGNMCAEMKTFLDQTGQLWAQGKLVNKAGAAFTSTSTVHGGQETTLQTMYIPMMHYGMIIVPPGYADPIMHKAGSPYGATAVTYGPQVNAKPTDDDLSAARFMGKRVAEIAARLKKEN